MANPDLLAKLYQQMSAEQVRYRDWLLDQPPADILNHAAEYTVREDIVIEMSELELSEAQAKVHTPDREPRLHGILAPPCRKGAPLQQGKGRGLYNWRSTGKL